MEGVKRVKLNGRISHREQGEVLIDGLKTWLSNKRLDYTLCYCIGMFDSHVR